MTWELHRHDARNISTLLEPDSVDLIVTSPPYFALRSYQDGGERFPGQLGSEPTPTAFLDSLIECTADWMRVLRPGGSIWVNLGDKYAGSGGHNNSGVSRRSTAPLDGRGHNPKALIGRDASANAAAATRRNAPDRYNQESDGIRPKSLMGLPWRYAIRCIDQLGLILRAEVIWDKPNGLPESVRDRVRRSHEQWLHFVKSPRYFAAIDEIRLPHAPKTLTHRGGGQSWGNEANPDNNWSDPDVRRIDPLGTIPGSVWSVESDLWELVCNGPIRFCPRCGRDLTAGNTSAVLTPTGTASSGQPTAAHNVPTDSPTSSTSDRSRTDSSSTTYAATEPASGPTISTRSRSAPTSCAATPSLRPTRPRINASTVTPSTKPTPTSAPEGAASVACVCETVHVPTGHGSTWSVPSEPLVVPDGLGVDHFAAFPSELPRRIILGWSPSGYCTVCNEPRRAVVERTPMVVQPSARRLEAQASGNASRTSTSGTMLEAPETIITGYVCACFCYSCRNGGAPTCGHVMDDAPPTRPAVVLDPFVGTGTTVAVANHLGRHGIGTDLSADYLRLAEWRCTSDQRLRNKVLERSGIPNPKPPAVDGQLDLLGEWA